MPVTNLTYSVVDNKLTIESIRTNAIEGDITLSGGILINKNLIAQGTGEFSQSLKVGADLTVFGTAYIEKLVTKVTNELKEPLVFSYDNGGVEGKGIVWKSDERNVDIFLYKSDPKRLFTSLSIDLFRGSSYQIDGTPVLNVDTLGPGVLNSSLRKVGRLKNLTVDGDVILGEHIFLDSGSGRVGFGTDHANAAFSLVDDNVEIVLGSLNNEEGNIGTFTSNDLGFITDNVVRMRLTRTGKVVFGDAKAANADVTINGRLFVKELIVDNKIEKTSPLEFKAEGGTNYGRGLIFTGHGINKQFVFAAEPDQFYSTENINIQNGKSYHIDRVPVLSSTSLGPNVTSSSLTEVGVLTSLTVSGNVNLGGVLGVLNGEVVIGKTLIDTKDGLTLKGSKFVLSSDTQSITIDKNNINLGDKNSPIANVIVNGTLGIGIQTVSNNAQFEVAGNIRFADRLFTVGSKAPTSGNYKKGDIVWNDNPVETGYVGWVCVREGSPGIWRGFGQIGVE